MTIEQGMAGMTVGLALYDLLTRWLGRYAIHIEGGRLGPARGWLHFGTMDAWWADREAKCDFVAIHLKFTRQWTRTDFGRATGWHYPLLLWTSYWGWELQWRSFPAHK